MQRIIGRGSYVLKSELQKRIKEFESFGSEEQASEYVASRRKANERREKV